MALESTSVKVLRALSLLAGLLACYLGLALVMSLGPGQPCPTGIGCGSASTATSDVGFALGAAMCVVAAVAARVAAGRLVERAERAADPWSDVRVGPRPKRS